VHIALAILAAVLDGDAVAAAPGGIPGNQSFHRIPRPDPVLAFIQNVLNEAIVPREGRFDAVGRGVRKVVAVQQVVVASAGPPLLHSLIPRVKEKAIAAVRGTVEREYVVAALFVHQDAG